MKRYCVGNKERTVQNRVRAFSLEVKGMTRTKSFFNDVTQERW